MIREFLEAALFWVVLLAFVALSYAFPGWTTFFL